MMATSVEPASLATATIRRHSKSFALASRLLDPARRRDTAILYAWCRRADDAVDEQVEPGAIGRLSRELDTAYAGAARDPVLAAFGAVVRARGIPRAYPAALVAGMAMDVANTRYRKLDELIAYAYDVAGVVGLMMTHVFGVADDDALVPAAHLGIAMQLTNVCRDVAEDWRRDRLYIPDELLAAHGAGGLAGDLGNPLPASAIAPLGRCVAELLALADRYYASADTGVAALPRRAAIAVRAARSIYAAIGREIARRGHDVTAGRAIVPRRTKLALAALACVKSVLAPAARRVRAPTRILELGDVPRR